MYWIRGVSRGMWVLGLWVGTTRAQDSALTLSVVPIGGSQVEGGQTVALEVFMAVHQNIRIRGGQIDMPCSLPGKPGAMGTLGVLPGLAGATSDPDGDGLRGPSSSGMEFLFGQGGLGPYQPSTCIIALTPGLGAGPVDLVKGQVRYLGTYFYAVGELTDGDFHAGLECNGLPDQRCPVVPRPQDTTRFRDGAPGMGNLIPLQLEGVTLSLRGGRCCRVAVCRGESSEARCLTDLGGTAWTEGLTCADGCPPCKTDSDCDDLNACTTDRCNDGVCTHPAEPDGLPCNDGLFCTLPDACEGGSCRGLQNPCPNQHCSEALDACVDCLDVSHCDDGNVCTTDLCDSSTGNCGHSFNSASCSDGLYCTVSDQCSDGACHGVPRSCPGGFECAEELDRCYQCNLDSDCNDNNGCTSDACVDRFCTHATQADGQNCDDGLFCTAVDTCLGGTCRGTGNPCTAPEAPFCNETQNHCAQCTLGSQCNDSNVCTSDGCNTTTGRCVFTNNTVTCDDGLYCTVDDQCDDGVCDGRIRRCPGFLTCDEEFDRCPCAEDAHCDDLNPCTLDSCVAPVCLHTPHPESLACDDGLFCSASDVCQDGACVGEGSPCAEGLLCQEDTDACVEPDLTLSLAALGGPEFEVGQLVTVEAFVTANRAIGIRGGQIDLPCSIAGAPGTSGSLAVTFGTSNPDGQGGPGPSSDGTPYLFGPSGLGPYQPSTCIIALTPSLGSSPVNLAEGARRYLGTFYYQVNDCASGDFRLAYECTNQPGAICSETPAATNTTRIRDDGPGMGRLALIEFQGLTLAVPGGQCCRGKTCLGNVDVDCCGVLGGLRWRSDLTCEDACLCLTDPDCNDDNACTSDECTEGQCNHGPVDADCDDGLFCTDFDQCVEGVCVGDPRVCPDGFPCDEELDECLRCEADEDCDDGDPCTADTCTDESCVHQPLPKGSDCDDGQYCTAADRCIGGECVGNDATCMSADLPFCDEVRDRCVACLLDLHCSDDNPCTADACNSVTGACVHTQLDQPCDDGRFCTADDQCVNGFCLGSGSPCPPEMACDESTLSCVPADASLFIDPIGGRTAGAGDTISVEVFMSAQRSLGIRGGQIDLPCTVIGEPGSTGTIHVASATTNPDGVGGPGPSSAGIPYLFGPTGLGPVQSATCIIALTPGVGSGPVQVELAAVRYLGTYHYQISDCAAGEFYIDFECGSGRPCSGAESASDSTRFRDDSAGMGQLLRRGVRGTTISIPVGQCCRGNTCLGEFSENCCLDKHGGTNWNLGLTCADACECSSPVDCDDGNPCTDDECLEGRCNTIPNEASCDDGLFCTALDRCVNGSCKGTTDRCPGERCSEALGACVECLQHKHCHDDNMCTTDRCDAATGACVYSNNRKPCSDGLYCTKPDVCTDGVCVGAPRHCPIGESCNEELDQCVPR